MSSGCGLKMPPAALAIGVLLFGSVLSQKSKLQCGGPAEENKAFSIRYTSSLKSFQTFPEFSFFDAGLENVSTPVLDCVSDDDYYDTGCEDLHDSFFQGVMTTVDDVHTVMLGIGNIERPYMETRWLWRSPGFEYEFCYLNVYAFSQDLVCDEEPYFYFKGTPDNPIPYVRVTCSIPHVYPIPTCEFESDERRIGTVVHESVFPYDFPTYFVKTCVAEWAVLEHRPGLRAFTMTASPDLPSLRYLEKSVTVRANLGTHSANCTDPTSNDDVTGMEIRCVHRSPYPSITCLFYRELHGFESEVGNGGSEGTVEYGDSSCDVDRGQCEVTCTLKINYSDMSQGKHRFRVEYIPMVSPPVNPTDFTPYNTTTIGELKLEPHVPMLGDCKTNYLNPRISHQCRCITDREGFPPTFPNWHKGVIGQMLVRGDDVIGDAILTFNVSDNGGLFSCFATAMLEPGISVTIFVQFASGPDSASIPFSVPTFILCDSDPTTQMTVSCDVNHATTKDTPTAVLTGIPGGPFYPTSTSSLEFNVRTRYQFDFRPTEAGTHTAKCVSSDSVYPFLSVETDFVLTVFSPPTSQPVITAYQGGVLQGSTLTTIDGESIGVRCRVNGGTPEVSNTILLCDGLQNKTAGSMTSRDLQIATYLHDQKCKCWAEHPTDCYTMTSEITFNIQYQATIVEYSMEGKVSSSQDVEMGSNIAIECKANGNPRPQIEIEEEKSGALLTAEVDETDGEFGRTFRTVKVMTACQDSGVFICRSKNGIGAVVEKRIDLNVLCKPQLRTPSHAQRTVNAKEGLDKTISYNVLTYPEATSFVLQKVTDSGTEEVPDEKYQVTVTQNNNGPPFGKAVLTIRKVQRTDVGRYQLTMGNDLGEMEVSISLVVIHDESNALTSEQRDAVIGGSVSFFVLIVIIIIAVIVYLSSRRRKKESRQTDRAAMQTNDDLPVFASPARANLAYQGELNTNPTHHASSGNLSVPSQYSWRGNR